MNKKVILIVAIILIIMIIIMFLFFGTMKNTISDNTNYNKEENVMDNTLTKINININGNDYVAILEDNETSKELLNRLPLSITMNELNGNEKYYYFDESFPSNSSRVGTIHKGDLMLYGSDCLVLFYDTFNTTYTYTKIGKIIEPSHIEDVVGKGNVVVSFTKID